MLGLFIVPNENDMHKKKRAQLTVTGYHRAQEAAKNVEEKDGR